MIFFSLTFFLCHIFFCDLLYCYNNLHATYKNLTKNILLFIILHNLHAQRHLVSLSLFYEYLTTDKLIQGGRDVIPNFTSK